MIGIEIKNNTPNAEDVQFLGFYHRHLHKKGITFASINGNVIYDDGSLLELVNSILAQTIRIVGVRIKTGLLFSLNNKVLSVIRNGNFGEDHEQKIYIQDYRQASHFDASVIDIQKEFLLDFSASLKLTNVMAGETVYLFLFPHNESARHVEMSINEAISKLSKTKIRKLLLTL